MSGLEILGAVAAAAQLVDYGITLSAKAVQVYRNAQGTTDELQAMNEMALKFRDMNQSGTLGHQEANLGSSPSENAYAETARQSNEAATELLQVLSDLRIQGEKSRVKSLRIAWKADWKQTTVEKLQRRLVHLREQLNDHLVRMIKYANFNVLVIHADCRGSDRQSLLAKAISRIERNQRAQGKALTQDFEKLKADLLVAIKQKNHVVLSNALADVQTEGERVLLMQDILASLRFEEMHSRLSRINAPGLTTCEWIFDSDARSSRAVRYTSWLENDNGIFWVTGKAGSGKSTLMKHIASHPQSKEGLERWANGRRLFTASHYFWYLGTPMQKSYEGLLQSILYDVLRQCPNLIEYVCETRWHDDAIGRDRRTAPWTLPELRSSIDRLAESKLDLDGVGLCFCFFVDGLDEYAGDHDEVVRLLCRLAEADNIKICASSRPWEVFQQSFVESTERNNIVILHQHTKDDIAKVVHQELDAFVTKRVGEEEEMNSLVSDVIHRSQGVFLWVSLVIKKELLPGFRYADSVSLLRKRLEKIPQELEDYFEQIFSRIPAFYRRDTGRIFRTCLRAGEPLPVHVVQLIISDDLQSFFTTTTGGDETFDWSRESLIEDVRKQINGRCQDLLEVYGPDQDSGNPDEGPEAKAHSSSTRLHHIDFLHRSVKDYLQSGKLAETLSCWTEEDFDPAKMLLACYTFLINKRAGAFRILGASKRKPWPPGLLMWSSCALLHAADAPYDTFTQQLMVSFDRAMTMTAVAGWHWANETVYRGESSCNLSEQGQRDFLGHLIEMGVVSHALGMIKQDPTCLTRKDGRPYLDYALRYQNDARYRKARLLFPGAERFPLPALVKGLLSYGSDVNQRVWIYDGRTVWSLFLAFIYDMPLDVADVREVTWLMIDHGAEEVPQVEVAEQMESSTAKYRNVIAKRKVLSMQQILTAVFGEDDAVAMCQAVATNAKKGWASYLKFW